MIRFFSFFVLSIFVVSGLHKCARVTLFDFRLADKMVETFQKQIDLLMTDYSNQHNKLRRRSTKSEREKHKRCNYEK